MINKICSRGNRKQRLEDVADIPLVVSISVRGCRVRRILLNMDTVANILFQHAFEQMNFDPTRVTPYEILLIGFVG